MVRVGKRVTAIEVKSGRDRGSRPGMAAFAAKFPDAGRLLVGDDGIPLEEFLSMPVGRWASA